MSNHEDILSQTPLRIISEFNDFLVLYPENLKRIFNIEGIDQNNVVICSIVGAPKTGKSFLLNLCLQYWKCEEENGTNWIGPLLNENQCLVGFPWSDVPRPLEQGIYMWPTPFKIKDLSSENHLYVFLMDTVKVKDGTPAYGQMEDAVCFLSSILIDNHMAEFKPYLLQRLHSIRDLSRTKGISLCNSIAFLIRDFESATGCNIKAINYVEKVLRDEFKPSDATHLEYDKIKQTTVEACLLSKPENIPVSNQDGFVNLDSKLVRQLQQLFRKIFDSPPKMNFNGQSILNHFDNVINGLNNFRKLRKHNHVFTGSNVIGKTEAMDCEGIKLTETQNVDSCAKPASSIINNCTDNDNSFELDSDVEMQDDITESNVPGQLINIIPQQPLTHSKVVDDESKNAPTTQLHEQLKNMQISEVNVKFENKMPTDNQSSVTNSTYDDITSPHNQSSKSNNFQIHAHYGRENCCSPTLTKVKSPSSYFPASQNGPFPTQVSNDYDISTISVPSKPESHEVVTTQPKLLESNTKKYCTPNNYQLSKEELDRKMQKEVSRIKTNYSSAIAKCNEQELDLQAVHNSEMALATEQLRMFLNPLGFDERDHINQLEKTIKLELKKTEAMIKKRKKCIESELPSHIYHAGTTKSFTNPKESKSGFPENCTSLKSAYLEDQQQQNYGDDGAISDSSLTSSTESEPLQAKQSTVGNIQDDTMPMDIDELQIDNNFGKEVVAGLLEDYNNAINQYFSPLWIVSDEEFTKGFANSRNLVLNNLTKICKKENLIHADVKTELENMIDTQAHIHHNNIISRNKQDQNFIDTCLIDFRRQMVTAVGPWIREFTDLNRTRKPDYASVYRSTLNQFLESCSSLLRTIPKPHDKQFRTIIERRTQPILNTLMELQNSFTIYEGHMNKRFDFYKVLRPEKFTECHQTAMESSTKELKNNSTFVNKLFRDGINNYKQQFEKRNGLIFESETEAAQLLFPTVQNFYNELMKTLVKYNMMSNEQLQTLHTRTVEEALKAFKKACNFHSDTGLPNFENNLKQELEKQFQAHKDSNYMKISKIYGNINKAIKAHQKDYNDKIDRIRPNKGRSMQPLELKKHHESFLQEEIKLLEIEIRGIDGNTLSSLDSNLQTLKDKILEDWDCIKESNAKKLEEEVQKEKETSREQKKYEAEEKTKELDELKKRKNESKKPLVNSGEDVLATEQQKSIPIKATTHHAEESNTTLPPIAIEFGLHKIKVGWINNDWDFETIRNSWGEEETLNTVALTFDNEVLIGSEVEHRRKSDLRFHYKLEEILNDPRANEEEYECNLNENKKFRKEFLCGLIFSRIKLDTEKQLKGNWTTAVITVPLGYTSIQRQATKDSAYIAGFTNVHLINETTAAALALSRLEGRRCSPRGNFFLVTVASDFHFDAAIYSYGLGKVEMISSCGDLHCSQPINGLLKSCLNYAVDSAKRMFWYTSPEGQAKSPISSILKNMQEDDRKKVRTMFIDVGSSKDGMENRASLKTFTQTHGEPCLYSRPAELILMGATYFAESLHNSSSESTAKTIFKDKATYGFQRKILKSTVKVFDPYQALVSTDVQAGQTIGLKSNGGTSIIVEEICGDKVFPWGTISMQVDPSVHEVHVNFCLNDESIFRAEAFVTEGKGRKNKGKRLVPVEFNTSALSDLLKTTYMLLVESLKKDEKKEAFEKSKKALEYLVGLIESKLNSVKSMIGKSLLENTVKEALTVIHHHRSTHEMVDIKTTILTGLMSKYIKDK